MRDALRPFEGQLVAFSGRLTDFGHRKDLACMSNCTVAPWDRNASINEALSQPQAIKVDHFWHTARYQPDARYGRICSIGRVGWYTRADGSVDLGVVRPGATVPIDQLFDQFDQLTPSNCTPREVAELFAEHRKFLDLHDAGELHLFGTNYSVDRFRQEVADVGLFFERSADATERALSTVQQNGRCDGLRKVSRLPGRPLKRASGFA